MSRAILAGIEVVALTQVWAGPLVARYLADLGADTIKIETCQRPDLIRGLMLPASDTSARVFDHSGYYHTFNRNQRGLAVDLTTRAGRDVVRKLVAKTDIVVENFSPRVMNNWGMGYDQLSELNPRLIMVSLSGFGATGPYRDYVAYGNSIDPMTGLVDMTGYEGGPPVRSALSYPDPIAATHAAFACLGALVERERSGKGQFIEVSMFEASTVTIGDMIGQFDATGYQPERRGNRHAAHAPYGVFGCSGDDEWVAIAVTTDDEWRRLCEVLGRGDLAADASLGTAAGRQARSQEIDDAISSWTNGRGKAEAMAEFQAAGVPAGAALTNAEVLNNEHLRDRGYFLELEYENGEKFEHPGFPFRFSRTEMKLTTAGPGLGQHNREILSELGYSPIEIDQMAREGVIGDTPSLPAA